MWSVSALDEHINCGNIIYTITIITLRHFLFNIIRDAELRHNKTLTVRCPPILPNELDSIDESLYLFLSLPEGSCSACNFHIISFYFISISPSFLFFTPKLSHTVQHDSMTCLVMSCHIWCLLWFWLKNLMLDVDAFHSCITAVTVPLSSGKSCYSHNNSCEKPISVKYTCGCQISIKWISAKFPSNPDQKKGHKRACKIASGTHTSDESKVPWLQCYHQRRRMNSFSNQSRSPLNSHLTSLLCFLSV